MVVLPSFKLYIYTESNRLSLKHLNLKRKLNEKFPENICKDSIEKRIKSFSFLFDCIL